MMKGDEEYFHSTDSWFKYFFGDVKNVDICDTFSFVTLNSQTAQKLVEVYRSKKGRNGKSLVEFSSN